MRALDWLTGWIDTLAAALLAAGGLILRRRRFRLDRVAGGYTVVALDGAKSRPVGSLATADGSVSVLPAGLDKMLAGAEFEVVAPAGAIVVRRLEPLPAESRGFMDGIVRHQLDRLVPWRADDVLHAARVVPGAEGRLDVTVSATSRSALAPAIAAAATLKASRLTVVGGDADAAPIPVPLGRDDDRAWRHARTAAFAAVGVLAAVLLAEIAWSTWRAMEADAEIAALDEAIADRRAVLKAAADAASRAAGPASTLDELKQRSPVAVVAIEAMSRTLPDDTYLTELRLEGGKLRLVGVSESVSGLVPQVEDSDYFKDAAFFAPTVRMPDGNGDRFSIEATIEPRTEIAP